MPSPAERIRWLFCFVCTRSPRNFGLSLTIAHLNHRIRGQEGDADEDFVRRLSAGLQLPFYSEAIEVKQQAIAGEA